MKNVKEKMYTVEVPVVQHTLRYFCSKLILYLLLQGSLFLTYGRGKCINREDLFWFLSEQLSSVLCVLFLSLV